MIQFEDRFLTSEQETWDYFQSWQGYPKTFHLLIYFQFGSFRYYWIWKYDFGVV